MPAATLTRDEVIDRLMLAFRRHGYAEASLSELSKATGLGKSSLYHYFPNGKEDMMRAVLEWLASKLRAEVFEPLGGAGTPKRRLDRMIRSLDLFYKGGREACLLGNLVVGETRDRFHRPLAAIFEEWIEAVAATLREAGYSRVVARSRAADAVIRIEGALVLAGAFGDATLFERTLAQLGKELLAPA